MTSVKPVDTSNAPHTTSLLLLLWKVQCFLIPGIMRGLVLINKRYTFGIVNAGMCYSAGVAFSAKLPVH